MVHFSGTDWFVDPKYKLLHKVGSGAYGFVVAADDVKIYVWFLSTYTPIGLDR